MNGNEVKVSRIPDLTMITLIIVLIWFALNIWMIVWATKRNGVVGFLLTFFLSFIGAIIVVFLPSDKERERQKKYFYCNSCYTDYSEDLLGGKNEYGSKVCRFCMEKKHKERNS